MLRPKGGFTIATAMNVRVTCACDAQTFAMLKYPAHTLYTRAEPKATFNTGSSLLMMDVNRRIKKIVAAAASSVIAYILASHSLTDEDARSTQTQHLDAQSIYAERIQSRLDNVGQRTGGGKSSCLLRLRTNDQANSS
jgi:hypothetical protein